MGQLHIGRGRLAEWHTSLPKPFSGGDVTDWFQCFDTLSIQLHLQAVLKG